MNNKTNFTTTKKGQPVFKTRLDSVCYHQARIKKALLDMRKALDIIDGPIEADECRFKLFISLSDAKEEFPKAKRFVIFVDPVNEEPNLKDIREAAAYVRKHQLGRIKIMNDFNHNIVITAHTAYKLDENHQLLNVLGLVLIDEIEKAYQIIDSIVGGVISNNEDKRFDPALGCINVFWIRK